MVEIASTKIVAGAQALQYLPQPTGYPDLAATDVPTTFADAPIGVALPPTSVPIASAHASVVSGTDPAAESVLITGTIVAANGILSMNADAIADTQMIIAIMI